MKFRPTDTVIISDNKIIIGPIIDRQKREWHYYEVTVKNKLIDKKFNRLSYSEFRNRYDIDYVELRTEMTRILAEADIVDDLQFMQNEILKCKKIMDHYRDVDSTKYRFYHDLIFNNTYKMFEFDSKNEYDKYIAEIEVAMKKENEKYINTVSSIIDSTFSDSKMYCNLD